MHTTLDVPLDVTIDNLNVVDVTGSSNQLTCMLIGLCFNRDIISGLHKDDLNGIIHLSDNKGKYYNQSVVRDTWRCQAIESNYPGSKVVTCSILSDSHRHLEDATNMNCDCNSSRFVSNIASKSWKINEIYIDSIRMQNGYLSSRFTIMFFKNLECMAKKNILCSYYSKPAKIYVPFCPHFLCLVHQLIEKSTVFNVSYLSSADLSKDNHKLSFVRTTLEVDELHAIYGKSNKAEHEHNIFSKSEFMSLCSAHDVGVQKIRNVLDTFEDVKDIRYIVLTLSSVPLTITNNSTPVINYCSTSVIDYPVDVCFCSKHIAVNFPGHILYLAKEISKHLLSDIPNTLHGISIATEEPMNNGLKLNITRPAVLRQYYGVSNHSNDELHCNTVAYGYKHGKLPVSIDPSRYTVKPFSLSMTEMSIYFHSILVMNKNTYGLQTVDLSNGFNSCTILLYHSIKGTKDVSSMGMHTDVKYTNAGMFRNCANTQKENTATVIFTIGQNRFLKWQKHNLTSTNKWSVDQSFGFQMLLQNANFVILHPNDERPHVDNMTKQTCKFHHGVRIVKKNTSVSFVFRVVTSVAKFRLCDNTIVDHGVPFNEVKEIERQRLYKSIEIKQYHNDIKHAMSAVFI